MDGTVTVYLNLDTNATTALQMLASKFSDIAYNMPCKHRWYDAEVRPQGLFQKCEYCNLWRKVDSTWPSEH